MSSDIRRMINWQTGMHIFIAAAILCMPLIGIIRSMVHRRREKQQGIGGTQDIVLWGLAVFLICLIGAAVCGAIQVLTG